MDMAAKKKKRSNPSASNHPGLWAAAGSALGAAPGAAMQVPGLAFLGSIAGGAAGGYFGADDDRKGRGLIGGAVGGMGGFIGAGVGGYIGGLKADGPKAKQIRVGKSAKKKKNPGRASTALMVVAGVAAVGAGFYSFKKISPMLPGAKADDDMDIVKDDPMSLSKNDFLKSQIDRLGSVTLTTGDLEGPAGSIQLPAVYMFDADTKDFSENRERAGFTVASNDGGGVTYTDLRDGVVTSVPEASLSDMLVVDIDMVSAQLAHELASIEISKGASWRSSEQRDEATRKILAKVVPTKDWSKGLGPYTYGASEWRAWNAVQLMGALAFLSHERKGIAAG